MATFRLKMLDLTKDTFEKEVLKDKLPVLVDFWLHGAAPAGLWALCWKGFQASIRIN